MTVCKTVFVRREGFELPLLLVGAFRAIVDELHVELEERGHPRVRPLHGFALQAVGPNGATVSELGRRLGVSKQAAGKTADVLVRLGYVERTRDAADARAVHVARTPLGEELLRVSAAGFARIRRRWVRTLGAQHVAALEEALAHMAGDASKLGDLPGWLR